MRFSVIIPSYLGTFPNCATNREAKFVRALDSLLNQTFDDFEAIIIGDGCRATGELMDNYYGGIKQLRYIPMPKQRLWSCKVRNTGILAAKGELITYLDTDDKLGPRHLEIINAEMQGHHWIWYDDYLMNPDGETHKLNPCVLQHGKCGTSNITHRRDLNMLWEDSTYAHDWRFILRLMRHRDYCKVATPEYFICHQPKVLDV